MPDRGQLEQEQDRILQAMLHLAGPGRNIPAERLAPVVGLAVKRVQFHMGRLEEHGDVTGVRVAQEVYPIQAALTGKGEERATIGKSTAGSSSAVADTVRVPGEDIEVAPEQWDAPRAQLARLEQARADIQVLRTRWEAALEPGSITPQMDAAFSPAFDRLAEQAGVLADDIAELTGVHGLEMAGRALDIFIPVLDPNPLDGFPDGVRGRIGVLMRVDNLLRRSIGKAKANVTKSQRGHAEHGSPQTLQSLIQDAELRERCHDLLAAGRHYDRAVREACVILEDRVRSAGGYGKELIGTALMEMAFSQKGGPLRLSNIDPEQRGAMELYRGLMAFFRNAAGHNLSANYNREDALRFVAFVDLLLDMVRPFQPKAAESPGEKVN